jgi:paraquat-inducible protein B
MTNLAESRTLPQAATRRSRRLSIIWIVPLVAVAIGAWLAWDTLSREGPTITISFESAEGLQAGQSQLKYKNLTLGTVKSLALSKDRSRVIVTVATTSEAKPLLVKDTIFWVVKPRLFAGNVSGFETLLSGSYIGMLPGKADTPERTFVGKENPPVLTTAVAGHTFLLKSSRLGSVSLGAPIFYRDLDVGEVLGWDIGDMAKEVTIHAFVRAPFDKYVHQNTRFWNASGLDVKLSGSGVEVELQSLRALLLGGIGFDTPEDKPVGPQSAENAVFPLFANSQVAAAASYTRKMQFVGEVTDVALAYDAAKNAVVAPVRFLVEPERVVGVGRQAVKDPATAVDELVAKQGLRASLASANLLTGQMLVALTFVSGAPPATITMDGETFVMPTTDAGSFSGLEASLSELLRKVNAVPLDKIGANLDQMTRGADELVNGPQLKQALGSLTELLATTQNTVRQLDAGVAPAARQLPELTTSLRKMIAQTSSLLVSLDSTYGAKTRFSTELDRSLTQLNDSLRSIQALADLLSRHPEALIRGRSGGVE